MKKHKTAFAVAVSAAIGITLGYVVYYTVFMEIAVMIFASSGAAYYAVSIGSLLFCIAGCWLVAELVLTKKVSRLLFILLSVLYFCVLFTGLFYRHALERQFIWNPLVSIMEIGRNPEMLFQSAVNLIIFIPMGFYMRNLEKKYACAAGIAISFGIEFIQGITQRGFFDTADILIYCLGMVIGYTFSRRVTGKAAEVKR